MCLFDYLKHCQTWNTSFSSAGAGGSIMSGLKFLDILAIWLTRGIFLTLAQWFTYWNCCTINTAASAHFFTIPGDNSLIHPICTIVVLTNIGNFYNSNIRIQKWLSKAIEILTLKSLDGCAFFKKIKALILRFS